MKALVLLLMAPWWATAVDCDRWAVPAGTITVRVVVDGGLNPKGPTDTFPFRVAAFDSLLEWERPRVSVTVPLAEHGVTDPSIPCVGWARGGPAVIIK